MNNPTRENDMKPKRKHEVINRNLTIAQPEKNYISLLANGQLPTVALGTIPPTDGCLHDFTKALAPECLHEVFKCRNITSGRERVISWKQKEQMHVVNSTAPATDRKRNGPT